jgi:hypothetical protein
MWFKQLSIVCICTYNISFCISKIAPSRTDLFLQMHTHKEEIENMLMFYPISSKENHILPLIGNKCRRFYTIIFPTLISNRREFDFFSVMLTRNFSCSKEKVLDEVVIYLLFYWSFKLLFFVRLPISFIIFHISTIYKRKGSHIYT